MLLFIQRTRLPTRLHVNDDVPITMSTHRRLTYLRYIRTRKSTLTTRRRASLLSNTSKDNTTIPTGSNRNATIPLRRIRSRPSDNTFTHSIFASRSTSNTTKRNRVRQPGNGILVIFYGSPRFRYIRIRPSRDDSDVSHDSSLLDPRSASEQATSMEYTSVFFEFSSHDGSIFLKTAGGPFTNATWEGPSFSDSS